MVLAPDTGHLSNFGDQWCIYCVKEHGEEIPNGRFDVKVERVRQNDHSEGTLEVSSSGTFSSSHRIVAARAEFTQPAEETQVRSAVASALP